MNYLVEYEPEALADLEKLTKSVCQRIVNKINWLAENFDQITPQPLTADLSGFFKLRVGDYRVIYEKELFLLIELDIGERFTTLSFTSF
ncbi:MAG: type II toxin-antitoxin system RelE/ParE family toxin [Anabaena sp. CoA2_C59]|jgi:mRNA interferase RelE/StbE|nr:type II toxin-antitoxin system RelE/ParE family toxin [Anabaena sp. CoA2_C59]MDJ0505426.1 type II toxin-antitoxin system RelE/ParE family toxin [Nostocales cyanobacterium LE14-WE12]